MSGPGQDPSQRLDPLNRNLTALHERLQRLEQAAARDGTRQAIMALHQGLSRLTDQVGAHARALEKLEATDPATRFDDTMRDVLHRLERLERHRGATAPAPQPKLARITEPPSQARPDNLPNMARWADRPVREAVAEAEEPRTHRLTAVIAATLLLAAGGTGVMLMNNPAQTHAPAATPPVAAAPAPVAASAPPAPPPLPAPPTKASPRINARDRMIRLASLGDPTALTILGLAALDGAPGQAVNLPMAIRYLTQAAQKGQAVAQYRLGTLYERGQGVTADGAQAMHWYELAADQGNRKAMHNLAVAHASGLAGKKNMAEAARWFAKAATLGLSDSQFNLAVLYERGEGVPQSLTDAYQWYSIAAATGDQESKQRLAALQTQLPDDDKAMAAKAAADFRVMPLNRAANAPPEASDLHP